MKYGSGICPNSHAVFVTDAARREQGLPDAPSPTQPQSAERAMEL
jgi:hypothetical protein